MPTYKYVFEFTENNGAGFDELHYRDKSSISEAAVISRFVIGSRVNLMDPLTTFQRVRISNTSGLRETAVVLVNRTGVPAGGGVVDRPVAPGSTIVVQLTGAAGGQRKIWVRGWSEGDAYRDTVGRDQLSPAFRNFLNQYIRSLAGDDFGVRRLTPLTNPAVQLSQLTMIDGSAGNGTSLLTMSPGIAIPANSRVIISRTSAKDFPRLNGHFSAVSVTGTTFRIPYSTPKNVGPVALTGYVKLEQYSAVSVYNPASSGFLYLGTRDTRGPLSRSRGAKRAARIRLSP